MNRRIMTGLAFVVLVLGLAVSLTTGLAAATPQGSTAICSDLTGTRSAGPNLLAASDEPPRISLADFKALYDNPATRPLILDVRSPDLYAEAHIAGASSFPEADVDARVGELPKDKLIVAYCQ